MKIYNTLSQKKETFTPVQKGHVGMYVCGPTVYDVGHLGHARAAVSFDIIRRYFLYKGFKVTFVSNITDVDDKMIKRAAELKITEAELAAKIIPEYEKDYSALHVLAPDHQPRATEYIPKMTALIERLIKQGAAYQTKDGIYFEVSKYKKYGELSHQKLEELRAGSRIAVDENKKNPEDFALWKAAKLGEPKWPGPIDMAGRPGWHIECSAMSMDLLGETFDIHGGGIDLQFPHHEDERTQSEMATGKIFAKYWLHNGHIKVNKEKMSKSLGNFFTIKEILAKYHPLVVRYFLLSTHYRMPIDFSDDLLEQAKASLSRLHDFMRRLKTPVMLSSSKHRAISAFLQKTQMQFEKSMDDDFGIGEALAAIFEFVKQINIFLDRGELGAEDIKKVKSLMEKFDSVLAVFDVQDEVETEIERSIEERNAARRAKDFKRADEIRKELKARGIELEDTKEGTIWKKAL